MRSSTAVILWAILLSVGLLCLRPINDLDLHTQIVLGNLQLNTLSLIHLEPLVTPNLGTIISNPGWLSQISFAVLQLAGWQTVEILFYLAVVVGVLALLLALSRSRAVSPAAIAVTLLITTVACSTTLDVRPQGFAIFTLGLMLLVATSNHSLPKKALGCFLLGVLWQNLHPSVAIGGVWLLLMGIEKLCRKENGQNQSAWSFFLLGALVLATIFATPEGFSILAISQANLHISRSALHISEWLPVWDPAVRDALPPFLLIVIPFLVVLRRERAAKGSFPEQILAPIAFAALSFQSSRFILFFALAATPQLALFCDEMLVRRLPAISNSFSKAQATLGFLLVGGILAGLFIATKPPTLSAEFPAECIAELKKLAPSGTIYNYREWAGPLHAAGYQTTIDGRLYLYPLAYWQDHYREARGEVSVDDLVQRYHPTAFMLRVPFDAALIAKLEADPRWKSHKINDTCVIATVTPSTP